MRTLRVGIIGGGIGGMALAGALTKFGIDFHLFERAPAFGEIGAGVQVTPNAVKVIRALGLWSDLRDVSFLPQSIVGRDWKSGAVNFRTPLIDECPRLYGAEFFHTHRADLHRILQSIAPSASLHLSAPCISATETGDTAIAKFADGTEFKADILVGADGLLMEMHPNPDKAMSDGAQSLYPEQLEKLIAKLRLLAPVVGRSVA